MFFVSNVLIAFLLFAYHSDLYINAFTAFVKEKLNKEKGAPLHSINTECYLNEFVINAGYSKCGYISDGDDSLRHIWKRTVTHAKTKHHEIFVRINFNYCAGGSSAK